MESRRGDLLNRINRLSQDLSANHRPELRELKGEYNRIVDDMAKVSSNVGSDILDVFPPEVWIQIVKDALPARGYSSALLLLTMVSNKWMQALTSVPTLWACIDLLGSQEDSLATIEVFKWLSGDISLKLSIYVPTRHDIALIHDILASVAPRLCEVTLRREKIFLETETYSVVYFLLSSQQYTNSVVYIHIDGEDGDWPRYNTAIVPLLVDTCLPPLLRGLSPWRFLWRDFQQAGNYLQNVEEIGSSDPLELVITDQIQLPRLKSLNIHMSGFPGPRFESTSPTGLPRLVNLTSLTYNGAFRDALIQLLTSVTPQLLYLELRMPHAKVSLFVPCFQAAMSLRVLSVNVDDWDESDQGKNNINDPPISPVIVHNVTSLKDLTLRTLPLDTPVFSGVDGAYKESILSSLIRAISLLYRDVETLEFRMDLRSATCTTDILSFLSGLNTLKKLNWRNFPDHFDFSKQPMMEARILEHLDTNNPGLLLWVRATNLLSLSFPWGYYKNPQNLSYDQARKLRITYKDASKPIFELPEDSFPFLLELTLAFQALGSKDQAVHGGLKLTSFQMLSTITISSNGYLLHETMLCFTLLYQPEKCPALNEIRFRYWTPDWDSLFLMLEKRNFMLDTGVSRIRTITLPFIPNELRAPLASLLGGRYAERPSNEDIFMGGAQDLVFDERVPGCLTCLLGMRAGCERPVRRVGIGSPIDGPNQSYIMSTRFHWTPDPGHADITTEEWIKQRTSLHREFLERLDSWGKKYQRETECLRSGNEMEITEYDRIKS